MAVEGATVKAFDHVAVVVVTEVLVASLLDGVGLGVLFTNSTMGTSVRMKNTLPNVAQAQRQKLKMTFNHWENPQ